MSVTNFPFGSLWFPLGTGGAQDIYSYALASEAKTHFPE